MPFYCRLGIKSGSGVYSEKKNKKEDELLYNVFKHVHVQQNLRSYISSQHCYYEKQTSGHFWTFKNAVPCIPHRINKVTHNV